MSQNNESNKVIAETSDDDQMEPYQFTFIDMPWDDRTQPSKVGIVVVLVSILVATMGFVSNYLSIQRSGGGLQAGRQNTCHMVRVEELKYVARVYSIRQLQPVCVGLVVSHGVVITSEECLHEGPIVIRLGSWSEPRCRKNFAVDIISNPNFAELPKEVAFLRTLENISMCANVARIGDHIDLTATTYIVGRIQHGGKLLSRQPILLHNGSCTLQPETAKLLRNNTKVLNSLICAKSTAKCPIVGGDLLVQTGAVFGLALSTTKLGHQHVLVPFWKVTFVKDIIGLIN